MAKVSFDISVIVANEAALAEIEGRVKDMSVVFNNIADEWAKGNARKFNQGAGKETSGAALDADVFWVPLTEKYQKSKRKKGQADWLMVATGQLEATMTNPDAFFRGVQPTMATWGCPMSKEDENKLLGNAETRPVVFFDRQDRLMIRKEIGDYLALGGDYKNILFAQGLQAVNARKEQNIWNMEWQDRL